MSRHAHRRQQPAATMAFLGGIGPTDKPQEFAPRSTKHAGACRLKPEPRELTAHEVADLMRTSTDLCAPSHLPLFIAVPMSTLQLRELKDELVGGWEAHRAAARRGAVHQAMGRHSTTLAGFHSASGVRPHHSNFIVDDDLRGPRGAPSDPKKTPPGDAANKGTSGTSRGAAQRQAPAGTSKPQEPPRRCPGYARPLRRPERDGSSAKHVDPAAPGPDDQRQSAVAARRTPRMVMAGNIVPIYL